MAPGRPNTIHPDALRRGGAAHDSACRRKWVRWWEDMQDFHLKRLSAGGT